ncbi:MAG: hydroxymethylbilane synthase [Candidatus Limnocylindrales bacterium]
MTGGGALRLGTRGSSLARGQSELVAGALRKAGHPVKLVVVATAGDLRPPDTAWGEGAFVGALEAALLAREVDLAVHSAKDVPLEASLEGRLTIAAYTSRQDPRDALVTRDGRGVRPSVPAGGPDHLADVPDAPDAPDGPAVPPVGVSAGGLQALPGGARVGTDSPRRAAFLRAARPDLQIVPLHGNVDTRLRRLDAGEVDALVLAVAGLVRLGHADRAGSPLDPWLLPPAPGQGALAVQCRAEDEALIATLTALDHAPTRRCVEAEREVLGGTGGGCRAPLGALATEHAGRVELLAAVVLPGTGPLVVRGSAPADRSTDLARALAGALRGAGFRGELA